jgi:hypothetical protein
MREIETNKGILKYRMPNVSECFDILDCMPIKEGEGFSMLKLKKNIIEACGHLVDHESVGYGSRSEMFSDAENMALPLSKLADEFYQVAIKAFEKKSS